MLLVGLSLVAYDRKLSLVMPATQLQYGESLFTITGLFDVGQDLLIVYTSSFSGADDGSWMLRVHLDGL